MSINFLKVEIRFVKPPGKINSLHIVVRVEYDSSKKAGTYTYK